MDWQLQLLASVSSERESLDEITIAIFIIIISASPPGVTHIHALDAHFFAAVHHHTSASSSLNRGDVIEIQGPPASGKTHLVYHFIITSITPVAHLTTKLGGWDKAAVVFDTDGTFNIGRLHELLLNRLTRLFSDGFTADAVNTSVEDIAMTAMKRVHVFRPTSSVQLASSLANLAAYHMAHLPDDEIGFIAVDSISSFYWPDRFTLEQINSVGSTQRGMSNAASPLHHVLISLQKIRLSHGPVITLTNWGLNPLTKPTQNSGHTTFYRQHLFPFPILSQQHQPNTPSTTEANPATNSIPDPATLPPLTHHITLPFLPITPFSPGISLNEGREQESKYRKELVTKGEVVGVIHTSGSTRVGRFVFTITENEVLVGDLGQ
jgi:DNA-repair protein XRCC2